MERVDVDELPDELVPSALYSSMLTVLMQHAGWAMALSALSVPLAEVNIELIELVLRDVAEIARALRSGDVAWMRRVASKESAELHRIEQEMALARAEGSLQ